MQFIINKYSVCGFNKLLIIIINANANFTTYICIKVYYILQKLYVYRNSLNFRKRK